MIRENDAIKPLVDYIERNIKKGYKMDDLRWALANQKHSRIEIEKAIKFVQSKMDSQKKKEEVPKIDMSEIKREQINVPPKKGFFSKLFSRD